MKILEAATELRPAITRCTGTLALLLATAGIFLCAAPTAHAAAPGSIVSATSGRCLDVKGASTTPGAAVSIYDCHGQPNQIWVHTTANELRTFGDARCLDVHGASTQPQARVESYPCNGGQNQQWELRADGNIVSVQSGLCLTVFNARTANGTPIDMWPCEGSAHQKWTRTSDTTSPTPPSGLQVSVLSCRSVRLTWSASSDDVGVAFYDIYHDGQKIKSVVGNVRDTNVDATPGALWGFYINARDAAGNVSQASGTVSQRIPQCEVDTQPPSTPQQLRGTASGTSVTLQWNPSTDNIGVAGYDVYRNDVVAGTTSSTGFVDSGLSPNTNYVYTVGARDAQDNVSPLSASIQVRTGSACANPVCATVQVATDTDLPWGLVQLADGSVLYTRRDAQDVMHLNPATGAKVSIGTIPNVRSTDGEGGLLGLAVTPDFPASDPWLYIFHTSPQDNRIVRLKYQNGTLDIGSLQLLLTGIAKNKFHNGGRLRFGPDGKLYASTGDAQNDASAQDIASLNGKVLRLNPDGSRPTDNPFGNYVWSYGHRNPQGLAFDAQGRLWEQEFGNGVQDETNLIQKGGNYGWPNCEGTVSQQGGGCATVGFIAPKRTYPTAEGSCSGIAIVGDVVYVACQRGTRMYREIIDGSGIGDVQQLFVGTYGRLRTVEPSIDGGLFMTTSNSGDKDSTPDNSNEKIFKITLGQ